MPNTLNLEVKNATYLDGFRLSIDFSDGKNKVVDFSQFITHTNKLALAKYKDIANFKKFKVEQGNVVWGRNWDLIFPIHQLYLGKINSKAY